MAQDQPGRAQGAGYVVRDEIVPDAGTEATQAEQPGPKTRLQKVASALRGDRPAPADETRPEEISAPGPSMADPNTYSTTAPATIVSTPGDDREADPGAGYESPGGTEAGYGSQAGTTPGHGRPAGTPFGHGAGAGTAVDDGNRADTGTGPRGPAGAGSGVTEAATTEGGPAGKHAAADAGLRPGEATDRLGDFGDIAFGNLLPDAERYGARWQQIQFRFVDDPQASVTEAADVVSQVTTELEAAIQERQRAIEGRQRAIQERASALRGRWGEGTNADTETLRETLRMYRAFMDQLIGPTP
jgi:hypothetical protein